MAAQAPRMSEAEKQALLNRMMGNAGIAPGAPSMPPTAAPAGFSAPVMPSVMAGEQLNLIERLAPTWGVTAGRWVAKQDKGMKVASGLVGVLMLIVGLFLLVGGGYTSIQGVRVPLGLTLQRLGYDTISPETFPAIGWWLFPLASNMVQIFSKHIAGLKRFWFWTVLYDSVSTAVYMTIGISAFLAAFERVSSILVATLIAALISMFIVVQSEKITFSALCVIRGAVKRKA